MGRSNIIKALEELNKKDIYSLILFILYNLKKEPEYSTLSELVYILDNENFIRLLNYYGGQTIRIPTTQELVNVLDALVVYEKQQNEEITLSEALKDVGVKGENRDNVLEVLGLIPEIVENYEFKRESN